MNRHCAAFLLAGVLAVAVLAAAPLFAQVPALPHAFFGTVTVDGRPVPVGARIEARGANVLMGAANNPLSVSVAGRYGGPAAFDPKLVVQGDVVDGTPLEFYVNDQKAHCSTPCGRWQDSYPYRAGDVTQLDLWVGQPPAVMARAYLPLIMAGPADAVIVH